MKSLLKDNGVEALIGLLVVLFAGWFVLFAYRQTGGGVSAGMTRVTALFPNATGLTEGTDVRVAGLKIGSVAERHLDPQSYQVAVTMALDPAIKLPSDSSASITSEGLLGGTFIALSPGGSPTPLKTGDTIVDTQGSIDMMGLVGQFINKSGGSSGGGSDNASTPAAAPAKP